MRSFRQVAITKDSLSEHSNRSCYGSYELHVFLNRRTVAACPSLSLGAQDALEGSEPNQTSEAAESWARRAYDGIRFEICTDEGVTRGS